MRPIYDATFLIPARLGKITYVRMFYPWEFFSGIFRFKSPRKSQIGNYLVKLWGMVLHPGSVEIKLWMSVMNTKLKRRKEMPATFTKLNSGEWGLRVTGISVSSGSTVTVTKKDGSSENKTIGKVLWSGNGVSLCTIAGQSKTTPQASRSGRGNQRMTGVCWECGGAMPQWLADKGEECGNC